MRPPLTLHRTNSVTQTAETTAYADVGSGAPGVSISTSGSGDNSATMTCKMRSRMSGV
jgi:hypothetical protein